MLLVYHLISQDQMIKGPLYGWETLMKIQQPARFGDIKHCDSGDIMYLVAKEQELTCSLKSIITGISEVHGMKAYGI